MSIDQEYYIVEALKGCGLWNELHQFSLKNDTEITRDKWLECFRNFTPIVTFTTDQPLTDGNEEEETQQIMGLRINKNAQKHVPDVTSEQPHTPKRIGGLVWKAGKLILLRKDRKYDNKV